MFSHFYGFLRIPKCHILQRRKTQQLENSSWKPRVTRNKSTPSSQVARVFTMNAGDLGLISYYSNFPPAGEFWSLLSPALELLQLVLTFSAPNLSAEKWFRSDSSLGHIHCTLASALCHPYFSLPWKIFNYWHDGEQLHQTLGGLCCRTAHPKCKSPFILVN